jgi:hypothetical protein
MEGLWGAGKVYFGMLTDSPDMITSGLNSMESSEAAVLERGVKETDSFTKAIDQGAVAVLTEWFPYMVGQGVGVTAEMVLTAFVGGLIGAGGGALYGSVVPGAGTVVGSITGGTTGILGGLVAKKIVKQAVIDNAKKIAKEQGKDKAKEYVEKELAKAIADPKTNKILKNEINKYVGKNIALTGTATKFGVGETVGRAVDEALIGVTDPEEQVKIIQSLNAGKLGGVSAAHAIADFVGGKLLLKPLEALAKPTQSFFLNFAKQFGASGLGEIPVEMFQSFLERYGANLPTRDREAILEYIDAGAAGFVMPVAPSIVGAARTRKSSNLVEEDPEIQEDKEPDIEDSRNKKINDIINDEKIKTQVIEEKKAAERINKTELNTVDKDLIKDLGLNPLSTAAKELEGKDLSNLDDLEMVDKILANENLNIKHNKKAVNNLKRIIKKNKIVLLETQQQEAQNALTRPRGSKPSPTGKSAGVSQLESEQSQPTPSGTQNLDGDSVVAGGGRTTTTTGPETRVDAPLTDQEKALKIEIARKYLPRIEEARKKLRPLEEAELAKVNGDQAATYKLMAKQEARRQKAFMEINDEGMAEFEASRGRTTTTTGPETRVDAPLIDNPKNPIIKNPKIGSKVRIGRINNGKPEVLKGVIQEDPKLGRVLVSEEQGGTRIIPLTNSQILNPTTNDVTQLDSLANRIKESKSKKQQLLDTKKEKEDTQESRVFDPKLLDIESRLAQAEFEVQSYLRQDNKVPPFVANRVRALRKEKTDYLNTQSTQESRADTEGTGQVYYRGTSEKFDNVAGTGGVIYFSPNREEAKIVGGSIVAPYRLKVKNTFDINNKAHLKKVLAELSNEKPTFFKGRSYKNSQREIFKQALEDNPNFNFAPYEIIEEFAGDIEGAGFDSFFVKEQAGYAMGAKNIGVFDSSLIEPVQESRADTEGTGQTTETVTAELVEEFGPGVNRMIESGKLVIVNSVDQLPDNIEMSSTANGAFNRKTGTTYIVANRVQKGQARRVLLHEIGEHYGLERMVGKDYIPLLNRLKTLRKQNAEVQAIFDEVQRLYPEFKVDSIPFLQEVMAKLGERSPNNSLFRRIVGAVKNFLRRLGLYDVNKFSDKDIQDMILNSLRVSIAETTGTRGQVSGTPALQMSKERETSGFTQFSRVDKLAEKQNIKQEVEDAKSNKQKEKEKARKDNKKVTDPADPFFNSNDFKWNLPSVGGKLRAFQNGVFGYDIALYNRLRKEIIKASKSKPVKEAQKFIEDTLAKISIAQAVHAETLASAFREFGGIIFDKATEKFEVIKNEFSMRKVNKLVEKFANTHIKQGKFSILRAEDIKTAEEFISQALIAKQLKVIINNNDRLEQEARSLVRQGKIEKAKDIMKGYILVAETSAEVDSLIERFNRYPELQEIQDVWIGVKNNVLNFLLENEVIGQEQHDNYTQTVGIDKDAIDEMYEDVFVPLYREGQTSLPRPVLKGTKSGRGLFVPRKGSLQPVNNVFQNMERFVQVGITQGIANKTALQKIRTALEFQPEDNLIVRPVAQRTKGFEENSVEVSEIGPDGKQRKQLYEYSYVMYAKAINGAAQAMLAGTNMWANASTMLRDNIVKNPVFGLSQTFIQDMYSAMYASGLRYGVFMIPLRVMYEFPATILGISRTHKKLNKLGATGGLAFVQNDNAIDRDINTPGFYNALIRRLSRIPGTNIPTGITEEGAIKVGNVRLSLGGLLSRIAMASDNSVRQAVYDQALFENKSHRRALEMAFELINFRRAGDYGWVTTGRQYVPFFGAALQALSVQGKVIQGLFSQQGGVTPTARREAVINFVSTWAQTAGVAFVYTLLQDDDDDKMLETLGNTIGVKPSKELKEYLRDMRKNYAQLDNKIRDRRWVIGDEGFHLTLRADFFTYIGKVIPEQVYNTVIAESQDSLKFWDSLKRNAKEIVLLNLIPQLVRPMININYNEDSRTGRPIVPERLEGLPSQFQTNPGTSEAAKKIGAITGTAPIKVDYFFRQYTGYTGAIVFALIDSFIDYYELESNNKNKPAQNIRNYLAGFPGGSNFYSSDRNNRLISDYYEFKTRVDQVVATFDAYDKNNFDDRKLAQEYLDKGINRELNAAAISLNIIEKRLAVVRQARNNIYNRTRDHYSSEKKQRELELLDKQELGILHQITNIRRRIYGNNPFYDIENGKVNIPGLSPAGSTDID